MVTLRMNCIPHNVPHQKAEFFVCLFLFLKKLIYKKQYIIKTWIQVISLQFLLRGSLRWRSCQLSCMAFESSLQNRRISGASAINESAREAREPVRSAKPESSACSHTIVYALPTVRLANGLC